VSNSFLYVWAAKKVTNRGGIDGGLDLEALEPAFARNLGGLFLAGRRAGFEFRIYSAFRSVQFQAQLYADDKRKNGGKASGFVAPPGRSNHGPLPGKYGNNLGHAVDISTIGGGRLALGQKATSWIHANARAYGVVFPIVYRKNGTAFEPWHCEYPQGGATVQGASPTDVAGASTSSKGVKPKLTGSHAAHEQFVFSILGTIAPKLKARGIPESTIGVFMAQLAIETGYGTSTNYRQRNNLAGIRGGTVTASNTRGYRIYPTLSAGGDAYVELLFSFRYAKVIEAAKTGNVRATAVALGQSPWSAANYRRNADGTNDRAADAGVELGTPGTEGFVLLDALEAHPELSSSGNFDGYGGDLIDGLELELTAPVDVSAFDPVINANYSDLVKRYNASLAKNANETDEQLVLRIFGRSIADIRARNQAVFGPR
jgi:hypothetical protein